MKLRRFAPIILTVFLAFGTVSCFKSIPDHHKVVRYVDVISEKVGVIRSSGMERFKNIETDKFEGEYTQVEKSGGGFFIGNGYFVTANHVSELGKWKDFSTPWGLMSVEREVKDVTYAVDGISATFIGSKDDIAVFHVSDRDNMSYFPISTTPLKIGQEIVVFGKAFDANFTWKRGTVGSTDPGGWVDDYFGEGHAIFSVSINPGDSGSPVLSFEEGKIVAVGMITAKAAAGDGYGIGYKGGYLYDVVVQLIVDYNLSSMQ